MNPPTVEQLLSAAAQGQCDKAATLLQHLSLPVAAAVFGTLPFEQQEQLFRRITVQFAADLVPEFPYYHQYVLLHTRPNDLQDIVEAMQADARMRLFDELPEETWRRFMDELSSERLKSRTELEPPATKVVPSEAILQVKGIEKRFIQPDGHEIQVIAPTDLSLESGSITALLGPSGSGKSTLLRILSGLAAPSAGEVLWRGRPLAESTPSIAIVFQSFALFPWLTVLENVEAPLLARGSALRERRKRALHALQSVGLKGFENAYPKELSGGMKQRVGFARALAVSPELLFMDEPFSALDVLTAENLRGELMELWLGKKIPTKSIFLVTHNIEEAVLLADRVIVLGKNPARIRADFRIPLSQPRERSSPDFLLYVDYIYKVMTQPELEIAFPCRSKSSAKAACQLPHARPGGIAGLLELLQDRGGREDIYHIADDLRLEVDDLMPIIEAAVLLGFANATKGDVDITPEGVTFAGADISTRKRLFREAALAHVPLLEQMKSGLSGKSDHKMPVEFFRDVLDEHFSEDETERQIKTALNWGRYAEIFTYDAESDTLFQQQSTDAEVS